MLHNPYTESKKLKEKEANAAPGDFPPVNKEAFGLGSGLRHPHKIRIKFLFLNIPAGSLNDAPAHDRSRPSERSRALFILVLPTLLSTSAEEETLSFDTDVSRKAELWDDAAQLKHLAEVSCLHRCLGSGCSTQARSAISKSLLWLCFGSLCCWEVNVRPSLRSRTLDQSFSAFGCLLLGDASVWRLGREAEMNGVMVDLLQRSPICIRMSGAQPESSLGFLVTLASPAQPVSFSSTAEETKCYKWLIDFSSRIMLIIM